jgi:hypothetical protein
MTILVPPRQVSARKRTTEDESVSSLVNEPKNNKFTITYCCFTLLLVRQINVFFVNPLRANMENMVSS